MKAVPLLIVTNAHGEAAVKRQDAPVFGSAPDSRQKTRICECSGL